MKLVEMKEVARLKRNERRINVEQLKKMLRLWSLDSNDYSKECGDERTNCCWI